MHHTQVNKSPRYLPIITLLYWQGYNFPEMVIICNVVTVLPHIMTVLTAPRISLESWCLQCLQENPRCTSLQRADPLPPGSVYVCLRLWKSHNGREKKMQTWKSTEKIYKKKGLFFLLFLKGVMETDIFKIKQLQSMSDFEVIVCQLYETNTRASFTTQEDNI